MEYRRTGATCSGLIFAARITFGPLLIFHFDKVGEFLGGTGNRLSNMREDPFAKRGRGDNTPGFGIDLADDVPCCSSRRVETEPCVCFQSRSFAFIKGGCVGE